MSRRAIACFATLLWACESLQAEPEAASYHVRRVAVRGGNPIQGVEGGVIFERPPGKACQPEATASKMKPVAASLGGDVSLDLEIGACPAGSPPPSVRCSVQVADETGPVAQFEGWQGKVSLPLPRHTLIYSLGLECSISGQPEVRSGTLYLTYQPPREAVRQPLEDWYRLACEWGAGLTETASESQVVERILQGLYADGQRFWRYGYCTVDPSGQCRFGETVIPITSPKLEPLPPESPTLGKCKWSVLAGGDRECNFTDCFGFSDMLHYISGTMGIGGLADEQVRGKYGKGFGTQGWLRSIDPGALGNLECGYRDLSCSFLFSVHDLRRRDGVSYDATFGRLYNHTGELVATDILGVLGSFLVILDRSNACFVKGQPYGAFSPLLEVPKGLPACPMGPRQSAVFFDPPAGSPVLAANAVELRSVEGDAKPELLRVQLTVEIQREGSYDVIGFLSAGPDGKVLAVNRPGHRVTAVWPSNRITGRPGKYPVTLWFSGEDVARASAEGPLWVNAVVVGAEGIAAELRKELPALSLEGLGEQPADLEEAAEVERVHKVDGEALRFQVPVSVRDTGLFAVDARLASAGKTVAYHGFRRDLTAGQHVLTIDFSDEGISRRGSDGRYEVTVELHLLDPDTAVPLRLVDSVHKEIGFEP